MVSMNDAGMRQMMREVGKKITEADAKFRAANKGKSAAAIRPKVKPWFAKIGVELTHAQTLDYAKAVASDAPFEWKIG